MAGKNKAKGKQTSSFASTQRIRMFNGKQIKPCLYDGPFGKYMAAYNDAGLVLDSTGRPREYKRTGVLVVA